MRLIDADALIEKRWDADTRVGYVQVVDVQTILDAPTIDAAPVVRGEWIHGCSDGAGTEFCYCSECSEDALKDKGGYTEFSAYCPNCGCDMRGESNDIRGGF